MSAVEREQAGVAEGLLRIGVGLEDTEDVIADLAPGLARQ